jgi:hypothetical protein
MRTNFNLLKLVITCESSQAAHWDMANAPVSGREHVYTVIDHNFRKDTDWRFAVRVPYARCRDRNIQVQPLTAPLCPEWTDLLRRVVTFIPAENGAHGDKVYCKIFLHDPHGWRTKIGTRRGERDAFPEWMAPLRYRMRLKATVKDTHGTDGNSQVILLKPTDHMRMIWVYFATKVWVQAAGFDLGR